MLGIHMAPGIERLRKMSSKVVKETMHDSHTSEKVGYLTRAVEDLTFKLERHMEKEEEDRQKDRQDFAEYRSGVDSKVRGLDHKVDEVKEDVGGLKKYILGVSVIIGVAGVLLDKIDSSVVESIAVLLVKFLG